MDAPSSDNPGSTEDLLAQLYDELRAIAAAHLKRERPDHTLQPTAVVHEAYMRLQELHSIEWRDRAHFAAAAAGTIRRILVDHARAHGRQRRGGDRARLSMSIAEPLADGREIVDLVALDAALDRLEGIDARKRRVVELKFFGGLTIAETARELDVGTTTVEDDWAFARAWLHRELLNERPGGDDS